MWLRMGMSLNLGYKINKNLSKRLQRGSIVSYKEGGCNSSSLQERGQVFLLLTILKVFVRIPTRFCYKEWPRLR